MKEVSVLSFVIFALLIVSPVFASSEDDYLFSSRELVIDVIVNSSFGINKERPDSILQDVKANLFMFPKPSDRQLVLELNASAGADIGADKIVYEWKNPLDYRLSYGVKSRVETINNVIWVSNGVRYPISQNATKGYEELMSPTAIIDSSNPEIVKTASSLVEGESDLFIVENNLASYIIKNVEYNLSTLNEKADKKASWVLANKRGVCDDITNLFVAFNRALGIPARVVVGIAYTNSPLFNFSWGPHAWAEVYFPGQGWIPFDVTYGEIGFVDATHIDMMRAADSSSPSSTFEWLGEGVDIKPGSINMDAKVVSSSGVAKPFIDLKTSVYNERVGFGSYNIVKARVRNLMDYYVPVTLTLSNVNEIEIESPNPQGIVLLPRAEKYVFWIVHVNNSLDDSYIYSIPMNVYSLIGNVSDTWTLISKESDTVYDFTDIKKVLNNLEGEDKKVYSKNLNISCVSDKRFVYVNESAIVNCELWNTGNTIMSNLSVCIKECQKLDVFINQKTPVTLMFAPSSVDEKAILSAVGGNFSKIVDLNISVSDLPKLHIVNFSAPKSVSFNDEFNLTAVLDKDSLSDVKDVAVVIEGRKFSKTFDIPVITGPYNVVLLSKGDNLHRGANVFNITVVYADLNNRSYNLRDSLSVELVNVTAWQRFKIFIYDLADMLFGRS